MAWHTIAKPRPTASQEPATTAGWNRGVRAGQAIRQTAPLRGLDVTSVPPRRDRRGADRTSGVLHEFPHRAQLEAAFRGPIGGSALVDPRACAARAVPAFVDRRTAVFASATPSLEVAAHEAVHLMQNRGATHDAGMGPEGHAGAVVGRLTRGRNPAALLGSRGRPVAETIRDYSELPARPAGDWATGSNVRVSDNGKMAVAQDATQHDFWAEPGMIAASNATLTSRRSVIRLSALSDSLSGPAPDGSGPRTLAKVEPENVATSSSGPSLDLWADCGRSARDVMGAGEGTGAHSDRMTAAYTQVRRPWWTQIPILGPLLGAIFGGATSTRRTTAATQPEDMRNEIFNERLGGSGDEGYERYRAMAPSERERFDRETGINRHAAPGVAEGYATASDMAHPVPGGSTWNFHWGGVVMESNDDRVTLENYAIVGDPLAVNTDWEFQMYGSARHPGQTFHEQHRATGTHGDLPTTMPVRVR